MFQIKAPPAQVNVTGWRIARTMLNRESASKLSSKAKELLPDWKQKAGMANRSVFWKKSLSHNVVILKYHHDCLIDLAFTNKYLFPNTHCKKWHPFFSVVIFISSWPYEIYDFIWLATYWCVVETFLPGNRTGSNWKCKKIACWDEC